MVVISVSLRLEKADEYKYNMTKSTRLAGVCCPRMWHSQYVRVLFDHSNKIN